MQIFVLGNRVLVSWGTQGPTWSLASDGSVSEQPLVQGDLVWMDGEAGFSCGYNAGHRDGYEECSWDLAKPGEHREAS